MLMISDMRLPKQQTSPVDPTWIVSFSETLSEDLGRLMFPRPHSSHQSEMSGCGDRENLPCFGVLNPKVCTPCSTSLLITHLVLQHRGERVGNCIGLCSSLYSDFMPCFHIPQLFLISTWNLATQSVNSSFWPAHGLDKSSETAKASKKHWSMSRVISVESRS